MLPLPVLISRALGQLRDQVEAQVGAGQTMPRLAVWANVLRCVEAADQPGLHERDLASAARISKRLATAATTGAERRGWITTTRASDRGKLRMLQLSGLGRTAAAAWPDALQALDARRDLRPLRTPLEQLVPQFSLELPHYPASYGTADPSATGGSFVQGKPKEGVPAHGQDWSPVFRAPNDDAVRDLAITALLSQVLMAFTIDYEVGTWPLASTLLVVRHLHETPSLIEEVPGEHGIAGNGKSLLERHLVAEVTRATDRPKRKLVALTVRGQMIVGMYEGQLRSVEASWRARYGDELISELRAAIEPLAPATQPDYVVGPLHLG